MATRNDARRAERRKASAPSTVRGHGVKPIDVTVEDLSRTGIRFASNGKFSVGDIISIGLSGVGTSGATVAWVRDGSYGCSFLEPLPEDAVEAAFSARTVVQWAASPGPVSEESRAHARETVDQLYTRHRYWALPIDVFVVAALLIAALGFLGWYRAG